MSNPMAQLGDFVLKLKFLGSGDESTQIRRVRLPRICHAQTGAVSYEELVGLAISFVIPEQPAHASDFQVKLTYKDVDDDVVVIGSSEELLDAIDQFKEQRVLRITAEVKRTRTNARQEPAPQPTIEEPSRASSVVEDGKDQEAQSNDAGFQTGFVPNANIANNRSPMLQNAVESVVNIILNAAVAINRRQGDHQQPSPPVFYSPDGVLSETAGVQAPATDAPTEEAVLVPEEPHAEVTTPTEPVPPTEAPIAESAVEEPEAATAEKVPEPVVAPAKEEKEKGAPQPAEEEEEERPFIHGRHTCDSCLTTPIVGKRYHAVNMSDYDLCAKCYESHSSGGEIQFEAVELERDRHLQNRWHRRRERMSNNGPRGPARRFGPRGHHTRWGPNPNRRGPPPQGPPPPNGPPHPPTHAPPHHGPPPPCHPPHRGPHGFGAPPAPKFASWKGKEAQKASEEAAMEMAIKLSLQDAKEQAPESKPAPQAASYPPTPVETADAESIKSASTATSKQESVKSKAEEEKPVAPPKEAPVEPTLIETVDAGETELPSVAIPEPSAPTEEEVKLPATTAPLIVETVEGDDNEEASMSSDPFLVRLPSSDGSFSSEVSDIKKLVSNAPSPSEEKSGEEYSFSSDAAGNGDVAEMLGATLDECAKAIDAMVSESDRTSFEVASSANSSYVGVNEDDVEAETEAEQSPLEEAEQSPLVEATTQEVSAAEGATILESVGADQVTDELLAAADGERSEDDWHVVNEDQHAGSDDYLARAAQMIGSALFNSDMRSSGEMMSTLTGSAVETDTHSYASSALTSVPSVSTHVAAAQRERFSSQLSQLRALGIEDDARCVDILERLTAANIGCGSSDEVSVQEVVNELWK